MASLIVAVVLAALVGYLLGSLNMGILVCFALYKTDIRTCGSGNAGMTNVLRSFGKPAAALTLLGDVLKGLVSVLIGRGLVILLASGYSPEFGAYIGAIFAILGHMLPLYFGFRGGKGVATAGGAIIALNPVLAVVLLFVFLIVVLISKMVSLGSIIGISLYPLCALLWYTYAERAPTVFPTLCASIIAAIVVWMHRENLKRILSGQEYRFGHKKNNK